MCAQMDLFIEGVTWAKPAQQVAPFVSGAPERSEHNEGRCAPAPITVARLPRTSLPLVNAGIPLLPGSPAHSLVIFPYPANGTDPGVSDGMGGQ